jgi:hypothetical protein
MFGKSAEWLKKKLRDEPAVPDASPPEYASEPDCADCPDYDDCAESPLICIATEDYEPA